MGGGGVACREGLTVYRDQEFTCRGGGSGMSGGPDGVPGPGVHM